LLPKGNLNGKEVNQGKAMKEITEVQKQQKLRKLMMSSSRIWES
jgi:hypothetical protein